MENYSGVVGPEAQRGIRLDRYISEILKLVSRSQVKARHFSAQVNGKNVKVSRIVVPGDHISLSWDAPEPTDLVPEDIPFEILYEDERVVVINKPQGMVVHPGAGNRRGTLANGILHRRMMRSRSPLNEGSMAVAVAKMGTPKGTADILLRPGIVHRLDKDTSGVIIATYDDEALVFLANQFKARRTQKTYIAIVRGRLPQSKGRIETFIARDKHNRKLFTCTHNQGKHAVTLYRVLREYGSYSLVLLRPKTGRTHQLRVHMRYLGCPILGDPMYSTKDPRFPLATLMLHALRLRIILPGHSDPEQFSAPLPQRFKEILKNLKAKSTNS